MEPIDVVAAILLRPAPHTFTAKRFTRLSHHFPHHAELLHLLGDVEVFGFWAIVLAFTMAFMRDARACEAAAFVARIGHCVRQSRLGAAAGLARHGAGGDDDFGARSSPAAIHARAWRLEAVSSSYRLVRAMCAPCIWERDVDGARNGSSMIRIGLLCARPDTRA